MLTVYSNLIKREEVLSRIGDDIQSLANLLNDITCEIKVASAACKNKDIDHVIVVDFIKSTKPQKSIKDSIEIARWLEG